MGPCPKDRQVTEGKWSTSTSPACKSRCQQQSAADAFAAPPPAIDCTSHSPLVLIAPLVCRPLSRAASQMRHVAGFTVNLFPWTIERMIVMLLEVAEVRSRLCQTRRRPHRGRIRRDVGVIIVVCIGAITSLGTNANATFTSVSGVLGGVGSRSCGLCRKTYRTLANSF